MLDAEDIVKILQEKEPFNSEPFWKVKQLEFEFKRTGRPGGMWAKHGLDFHAFLTLFPKTFKVFGPQNQFVHLIYKGHHVCRVNDDVDWIMVREFLKQKIDGMILSLIESQNQIYDV